MARPRRIEEETLLEAARTVFVEKGAAATTREIAERAGVSEGLLFQRYHTKADLFFAALVPPAADPVAILRSGAHGTDARQSLEEAALRMLAYFREVMPLLLTLVNHPSFDPERFFRHEAPASLQSWIDSLVDFIAARRGGSSQRSDSRDAAVLLTCALFGTALIDTAGIHGAALADDTVRGMVRALWNGIEVPDPGAATG
jgi:AcrR family transcriptional regulator